MIADIQCECADRNAGDQLLPQWECLPLTFHMLLSLAYLLFLFVHLHARSSLIASVTSAMLGEGLQALLPLYTTLIASALSMITLTGIGDSSKHWFILFLLRSNTLFSLFSPSFLGGFSDVCVSAACGGYALEIFRWSVSMDHYL